MWLSENTERCADVLDVCYEKTPSGLTDIS